jgi:hypothetical protein
LGRGAEEIRALEWRFTLSIQSKNGSQSVGQYLVS